MTVTPNYMPTLPLPASALFGTDGIRSPAGELLTVNLALQIGFWTGVVLRDSETQKGTIVVGQDSRNSSNMLASAIAAGLTAAGVDVWDLGLCPTPCVAHLTARSEAVAGIMVSASHNPPADNGIKIFGGDGKKLPDEVQKQVEAGIRGNLPAAGSPKNWGKHYFIPELVEQYREAIVASVGEGVDLAGMTIILDLAYGAAVEVAPAAFAKIGATLICLHGEADGDRINVDCGSTHLERLKAAVIERQADLGFAFDGDADRVMAVDGKGRTVDGDYILFLWGKTMRASGRLPGDVIVTTVMANLGFEVAWQALGGKLTRTAVGDRYVQAEMAVTGAMLGGEQSGHILAPGVSVSGDGTLTALHLATIVRNSGKSLAELVDDSFQTYPQILKNVRVEDRETRLNWEKCVPLQEAIAAAEADMAGRGRVLVRPSGTEPLIRVMVEAQTEEMTQTWTERLVAVVTEHLAK
jgi:phosphoglucosamine mutase